MTKKRERLIYIFICLLIFILCFINVIPSLITAGLIIINYSYFRVCDKDDLKTRIFRYFLFPISIMIVLILWMKYFEFEYTPQLITVAGTITSALASIFIATTKEFNDKIKEKNGRKIFLKQIKEMLKDSSVAMEKEIENYIEFIEFLKKNHFTQKPLKTTPFSVLEKIDTLDIKEIFKSINENYDSPYSSELYLKLTKNINKALFLKDSIKNQYIVFINSFNEYAAQWFNLQIRLNQIYYNNQSNIRLKEICNNYNEADNENKLNLTSDIRAKLINPLRNLYVTQVENSSIEIGQISREIEANMNKIDEIIEMLDQYFKDLIIDLKKINTEIKEILFEFDKI